MEDQIGERENNIEYEFLRDYLYLDVDKVKSIAGQLDFGVPEELRDASTRVRRGTVGWNKVLSVGAEKSSESQIQRSALDSLFPELEATLEDGWLVDISDEFAKGKDSFEKIKEKRPEGSLFRLTAPGLLFDSESFLQIMTRFSTVLGGLEMLQESSGTPADVSASRSSNKGGRPKALGSEGYRQLPENPVAEDLVEFFKSTDEISPQFLRSIARIMRGFSSSGTNLFLDSDDQADAITVAARFQQNRRYFDADPSILSSQFGLSRQRWTIVGTIGHYSRPLPEIERLLASAGERGTLDAEGKFRRGYLIDMLSNVMQHFGAVGLSDVPQHPGISVIPMAVYRSFERVPNV